MLSLPIDQDGLLPSTWHLVGSVNTTRPAARALLPLQQFVTGSRNAALTCRRLFRVFHPADEFIATQRCQLFPKRQDCGAGCNCGLKVFTRLVDRSMRKDTHHNIPGKRLKPDTVTSETGNVQNR
jgi:hypothetical protein